MRTCDLLAGTIIGASVVALGLTLSANADNRVRDEQAIRTIEHKIAAATTTDQLMQFCDRGIVLYDFVPPLKYEGFETVRAHEESIFLVKPKI